MARLIPSFEQIQCAKPKPTEGEINLLKLLVKNLDDSYYIYFQSYLNGYRPDIIIIKEEQGVFIIEVKDWELQHYICLPKNGQLYAPMKLKKNGSLIKSPFDQVKAYKNCLYQLYVPELTYQNIMNERLYGAIKIGVYFDKESQFSVDNFFNETRYVSKWGYDGNIVEDIQNQLLYTKRLDVSILNEIKRLLEPQYHKASEGKNLNLSPDQLRMIKSVSGKEQKLLGLAGSGKTTVISYRAINVIKRLNGNARVLILTFNITLRNYIKDKISLIREDFSWSNFNIVHFHMFIIQVAEQENIPLQCGEIEDEAPCFFANLEVSMFEGRISDSSKYDAIIIDEGQDFEKKWFDILKKCFLKEGGEFLIIADEKQNIYNKQLDNERKVVTNIRGNWNRLKKSHRMDSLFMRLAHTFQQNFFKNKYELDENMQHQLFLEMEQQDFLYYRTELDAQLILKNTLKFLKDKQIHPNNCCFLSNKVELLRTIEYLLRTKHNMQTEITFETKEQFEAIEQKYFNKNERLKQLDKLRRSKKFGFYNNSGKIKLSTIHSFKGWENDHIILIIDSDNNLTPELLYTAITRCKKTLTIYNDSEDSYHDFFIRFLENENKMNGSF